MQMPGVSEGERHYLRRVAEDCEQLLGPGIEMRGLELDANRDVVLRLTDSLGRAEWTSERMAKQWLPHMPTFGSSSCSTRSDSAFG
ncbi:MAG: hypothetical protein ACJ779_09585 [Chloroflexota bacterium]